MKLINFIIKQIKNVKLQITKIKSKERIYNTNNLFLNSSSLQIHHFFSRHIHVFKNNKTYLLLRHMF